MCGCWRNLVSGWIGNVGWVDVPQRDIRFTTTSDGVSIAFWEIGSGVPIVIAQNWILSHAELEWSVPSLASFYVELARRYRVVRFDPRGAGLSGDPPGGWEGFSIHESGLDISAVVEASGLDQFALMAVNMAGPVGIKYAASNAKQVTALILCDAVAKVAGSHLDSTLRGQVAIAQAQSDLGIELPVRMWERVVPTDEREQWEKLIGDTEGRDPDEVGTVAQMGWNAEAFQAEIKAPTLVMCARNRDQAVIVDAQRLAAAIPNAQLRMIDGSLTPYVADRSAVLESIDSFLQPGTPSRGQVVSGFRTVVFTDIVESTKYMQRVGDEQGRMAIRGLEQKVASLAADHQGRVVKNLGDGSLVSFGSNSSAITFALDLQDACGDGPLQLRVGMAAGEPIQEDGDIHGAVVAQASRIGDIGKAGEVIVSDAVCQLAVGKGFTFEPRGEVDLKGFDQRQKVWKVTQTPRT